MWTPQRTLAECDVLLCAPGMPHEMETRMIDGRLQRVYKDLYPTLREFWLQSSSQFKHQPYVVYEDQRLSFDDVLQRSLLAAKVFQHTFKIQKGDRVAICSRNLPEYLVAFWACHLIGAVSVLVNAWLPVDPLLHCLRHTSSTLIILDSERTDHLLAAIPDLRTRGVRGFLVLDSPTLHTRWKGLQLWHDAMRLRPSDSATFLLEKPEIQPEDNATIIFTSGTTGLPKGVLSTQRQFLTNLRNGMVASARAQLRRGAEVAQVVTAHEEPQKGLLVAVPLFHVTGTTSLSMLATMFGMKIVLMRKWDPEEAVRLIRKENIRMAGGVPAMVSDLVDSSLAGYGLEALIFGGSAAHADLPSRAKVAFPSATFSQTYGMTETNSIAVGFAGEDYEARPTSTGLPSPVNDVLIVRNNKVVSHGQVGEVWLRGPNVMKCYWDDPGATSKALTQDGWLKTGDLGSLDEEGFLYIHDRIKDLIIRGGENIASISVENAIQVDSRLLEVAAVGVPDERLGELVAVVVSTKPAYRGLVMESEVIEVARKGLPRFAVPVLVIVQDTPFALTPSGKIMKAPLRLMAKEEWERRKNVASNGGSASVGSRL